ncbi:MAG: 4Fe-4S binding protein [Caldimicrobium sp.]
MPYFSVGKRTFYRRAIQILTFAFFFAIYYSSHKQSFILGTFYSLKVGPINIADPYVYIAYFLRNFFKIDINWRLIIGFLIPLSISFLFGRVFCSWICPYNFFYEIMAKALQELIQLKNSFYKPIKKYKILYLCIALFLGTFVPFITYYLILPGLFSLLLHQLTLHHFKLVILGMTWIFLLFLLDFFYKKRIWCKFICPTGIILSFVRWQKGLRVIKSQDKECKQCALCSVNCPLGLNPHLNDHWEDCYNCGKCIDICEKIKGKDKPLRFKIL